MSTTRDAVSPNELSGSVSAKLGTFAGLKVAAHRLKERYGAASIVVGATDDEYEAAHREVDCMSTTYEQLMMLTGEMKDSWKRVVDVWKRIGRVMEVAGGPGGCWEGQNGNDLGQVFQKTAVMMQCLDIGTGLEGVLDDYHNHVRRIVETGLAPLNELGPKVDKLKASSNFFHHRLIKSKKRRVAGSQMSEEVLAFSSPNLSVVPKSSWMSNSSSGHFSGPLYGVEEKTSPPLRASLSLRETPPGESITGGAIHRTVAGASQQDPSLSLGVTESLAPLTPMSSGDRIMGGEELTGVEARAFEAREIYQRERNAYIAGVDALRSSEVQTHGRKLASLIWGFDRHFHSVSSTCRSIKDIVTPLAGEGDNQERSALVNGHLVVRNEDLFIDWIEICEEISLLLDLKKSDEEIKSKLRGKMPSPSITDRHKLRYMTLRIRCDTTTEGSPLHCEHVGVTEDENHVAESSSETLDYMEDHKIQYVFIGGTNFRRMKQILLDLHISLEDDEKMGIKIHKGFREAAKELYSSLRGSLNKAIPIKIVGSSLGGVVSQIIGAYLKIDGFTVVSIHAVASPRFTDAIGAQKLEKYIGSVLLRINNYMDVVRTLPRGQYKHFGRSLMLFDDGSIWNLREPPLIEPDMYTSRSKAVSAHRTAKYAKLCQLQLEKAFGIKFSDTHIEEIEDKNSSNSNDSLNGSPSTSGSQQISGKFIPSPSSTQSEFVHTADRGLPPTEPPPVIHDSRLRSKLLQRTTHIVAKASETAHRVGRRLR